MTPLERHLGRHLTPDETAIAHACGRLQGLAFICITGGIPLEAASRLASYMACVFESQAQEAARLAAALVQRERAAQGVSTPDETAH